MLVLSPVSPLYYKGEGQSPYPYNVEYIVTQIGRENKFSAENYVSRTPVPTNCNLPYDKERKAKVFLMWWKVQSMLLAQQ